MRRTLALLIVILATSLMGVEQSHAEFGDCTDEYVRSFEVPADPHGAYPAWSPGRIQCHEYFQVPIDTPDGEVIVRGIGDVNVAATLPPGGLEAIETGVEQARDRMAGLGDFDLDDTTILISRPRASAADPQPRFGYSTAWTLAGTSRDGHIECHVTLFIQTDYSPEQIQYAVAHELFHCIQKASLEDALIATTYSTGRWWSEGSAEWFAAWVVGPQDRWPRAAQFDEAVASGRALHDMSYRMAIFFHWFHGTHGGATAILPFLHDMSTSDGAAAQERAMRAALSPEQWLAFAQAYDDRRIRYPGGGLVEFGQRLEGETWHVDTTSAHERQLKSFVIGVGWAEYACGRWANSVAEANVGLRPENGEIWGRWPAELDTRASTGSGPRYRMVGLVVDPETEVRFTLDAERRESCTECVIPATIDRCVVGRWLLTAGGPLEWMRSRLAAARGVTMPRASQSDFRMTFSDDGTYRSDPFNFDFRTVYSQSRPMAGEGTGDVQGTTGRWAAQDGRFYGCVDGGGEAMGTTTLESRGRRSTADYMRPGPIGGGASTYTCNDTTLYTEAPMPDGDAMTHTFTRESPPPRHR